MAERFPADLERIRGFLRMPSVSATGEGAFDLAPPSTCTPAAAFLPAYAGLPR